MHSKKEPISKFRGSSLAEPARLAGYAALIDALGLPIPTPRQMRAISPKQRWDRDGAFRIHPSPHWPGDSIADHINFALKYEGVNLQVLNSVFHAVPAKMITELIRSAPTGKYARRLWFLYEWLRDERLPIPDSKPVNYVDLLDPELHVCAEISEPSPRHRVRDNLPGVRDFCPMVYHTRRLAGWSPEGLRTRAEALTESASPELLRRAAAFLLLADSKASFAIEGEQPPDQRIRRWAHVIGRAGKSALGLDDLLELQKIVIGDSRFVTLGLRRDGGFVGERGFDMAPLPEHISARPEDLSRLMDGMIGFAARAKRLSLDPIVDAACRSFGFVFIHPFEDGNGRLHRFMLHHVLAERGFTPPGIVFPVSAVILERILDYRAALQAVSAPMLPWIDWAPTAKGNVEIRNETIDFYRYFDATPHVEFLYECIAETLETSFPRELRLLAARDRFHRRATEIIDMPERVIDLLLSFLRQNGGALSKRARGEEFAAFTDDEVRRIEAIYADLAEDLAGGRP